MPVLKARVLFSLRLPRSVRRGADGGWLPPDVFGYGGQPFKKEMNSP